MAEGKNQGAQPQDILFSSLFRTDWLATASAVQVRFCAGLCRDALSAAARQLQLQADYARKLSEAREPSDVIACGRDFTLKTVTGWLDDGRHVLDRNVALIASSRQAG